jgi:hypothetical protein
MAPPPVVIATVQSTVMCVSSCLVAQAIEAYRGDGALVIDWVPVVQFALQIFLTTPLNFKWCAAFLT